MSRQTASFRGPLDAALVRCLAILLVTNSHLDALYPIPQLATGGALGNALFFTASGYGLTLSYNSAPATFWAWYWKRVIRLYPSVILVMGVFEFGIPHSWSRWNWSDYIETLLWPTPAWFISAMLIFYAGCFPFIQLRSRASYLAGLTALVGLYFYFYLSRVDLTRYTIEGVGNFNWIFYFGLMLLGSHLTTAEHFSRALRPRDLGIAICLLGAYFGFGYTLSCGYLTAYQSILHLITVPLVISLFRLSRSEWLERSINRSTIARNAVFLIAGVTLEIYLLQFYVYSSPYITSLPFPASVVAFWTLLVMLAWLTASGAHWMRRLLLQGRSG